MLFVYCFICTINRQDIHTTANNDLVEKEYVYLFIFGGGLVDLRTGLEMIIILLLHSFLETSSHSALGTLRHSTSSSASLQTSLGSSFNKVIEFYLYIMK